MRLDTGKKHLVLGGTGQLGVCMLRYLTSIGLGVRAIVRNVEAFYQSPLEAEVEILTGDMNNPWSYRPILEGSAVVYYCVTKWITQPHEAVIEMQWAESVANACAEYNVRLIVPICAWAYGKPKQLPVPESHPLMASSPYGTSKASVEYIVMKLARTAGLKATVLRIPPMWGPFARCPLTLNPLVAVSRGKSFRIPSSGESRVEWIDPRDVARTMLACAQDDGTIGKVYNIPGSGDIKWREFASWVTKVAATGANVRTNSYNLLGRMLGQMSLERSLLWWYESPLLLDGTAIRTDLKYENTYSLKQSIIDNWRWYSNRRPDDVLGLR